MRVTEFFYWIGLVVLAGGLLLDPTNVITGFGFGMAGTAVLQMIIRR